MKRFLLAVGIAITVRVVVGFLAEGGKAIIHKVKENHKKNKSEIIIKPEDYKEVA